MFVRVKTPKRILIVRPDVIGDVVLSMPIVSALKRQYPDSEISMLQQPYTVPLTEGHPDIKDVIIDWKETGKARGLSGFFKYAAFIRSFHFDMVVHVFLDPYYAALCWQAGIPIRIGDSNKLLLRLWLTHPVSHPIRNLALHEVEQNIALLTPFLKSKSSHRIRLSERDSDIQSAKALLKTEGLLQEPFILIHPTTGRGNRAWHPQRYAELIDLIYSKTNYKVVVTGHGPLDTATETTIRSYSSSPFLSLINKTTLPQLMGLVRLSSAVVGTDTGPTHIAAAFQIPVVGISPTKFVKSLRWGPWQTPHCIVGHPEACVTVCNPHRCTLSTCLDAITVTEVFASLLSLLEHPTFPNKSAWVRQSIRVLVCPTTPLLSARLGAEKISYFIFSKSLANLWALRRFLVAHDCTIIHTEAVIPTWYQHLIRLVCAPSMSVPPIFIQTLPTESQDITDFYMIHFSKWYPN